MSYYNSLGYMNEEERRKREEERLRRQQQGLQVQPQQTMQPNQTPVVSEQPDYSKMTTREELDDRFRRGGFFKEEYEREDAEVARQQSQSLQNATRSQLGMSQTIGILQNTIVDNQQEYEDRYRKNPLLTGLKSMDTQDWKSVGGDTATNLVNGLQTSFNLIGNTTNRIHSGADEIRKSILPQDSYDSYNKTERKLYQDMDELKSNTYNKLMNHYERNNLGATNNPREDFQIMKSGIKSLGDANSWKSKNMWETAQDTMEGLYRGKLGEEGYKTAKGMIGGLARVADNYVTGNNQGNYYEQYNKEHNNAFDDYNAALTRSPAATRMGYYTQQSLNVKDNFPDYSIPTLNINKNINLKNSWAQNGLQNVYNQQQEDEEEKRKRRWYLW